MKYNINPQTLENNNPVIKFISHGCELHAPNIKSNGLGMLNEEFTTRLNEEALFRENFVYVFTRWSIYIIIALLPYLLTITMESEKKRDPSHYEGLNKIHHRIGIFYSVQKWLFMYWCLLLCMYTMLDIGAGLYVFRNLLYHIFGPI